MIDWKKVEAKSKVKNLNTFLFTHTLCFFVQISFSCKFQTIFFLQERVASSNISALQRHDVRLLTLFIIFNTLEKCFCSSASGWHRLSVPIHSRCQTFYPAVNVLKSFCIKFQLLFLYCIIKCKHSVAADYHQPLLFKRMQPANKDVAFIYWDK